MADAVLRCLAIWSGAVSARALEETNQVHFEAVQGANVEFMPSDSERWTRITSGALAGIEGTEFVIAVAETNGAQRTTLSVMDGVGRFGNDRGSLALTNREEAIAEPGTAPMRTAGFIANHLLQWCFYYPAILDLNELPLTAEEQEALAQSLAAYRSGDLLAALKNYPATLWAGVARHCRCTTDSASAGIWPWR